MKIYSIAVLGFIITSRGINAQSAEDQERHALNAGRRLSVGYVAFDGYAPLDFWGPVQILDVVSEHYNMSLSVISEKAGPITSALPPRRLSSGVIKTRDNGFNSTITATHTPDTAPPLDLLMIPGGPGNLAIGFSTWIEDFVRARYNSTDYVASVCTGAMSLAKAGVLDGKRATTNKQAWREITQYGKNVSWVPNARWTHEGKLWTSSGVAAGMDMTYALLSWMYGSEKVNVSMNLIEFSPHLDEHWDPYAVVHNVPGADRSRPLKDLVGPVGFD